MNEEKKRPETPETPKKKNAISLGKIFYHNTFVLAFSFVVAVVTWFLMYANSAERNVVIHDVPITQQVSSAAQEEGCRFSACPTPRRMWKSLATTCLPASFPPAISR